MTTTEKCPHGARWTTCPQTHYPVTSYVRMHVADLEEGDVLRAYEPWHIASRSPVADGVMAVVLYDDQGGVRDTARLFELDSVTIRARETR